LTHSRRPHPVFYGSRMISQTDRILVVNHELPVGAAIVRRLILLGHPKSHILVARASEVDWADSVCALSFLQTNRPDQVYVGGLEFSHRAESQQLGRSRVKTKPTGLAPLLDAASRSGVKQFMLVATATTYDTAALGHSDKRNGLGESLHEDDTGYRRPNHEAALLRQALMDAFGDGHDIDYRCVLTCEPYGPSWSPSGAWLEKQAGSAGQAIKRMLLELNAAKASESESVTIAVEPSECFDLMFVDDIADAVVVLMELPRVVFQARRSSGCSNINLGTGKVVTARELVDAVASAVGYRGHVTLASRSSSCKGTRNKAMPATEFGWRPLVDLQTGLELTAMAFQISQIARHGAGRSLRSNVA
jgi:GDP-L-fucose synthase